MTQIKHVSETEMEGIRLRFAEAIVKDFTHQAANLAVVVTAVTNYTGDDQPTKNTLDVMLRTTRNLYDTARTALVDRCDAEHEHLVRKLGVTARAYEIIRLYAQEHNRSLPTHDLADVTVKLRAAMDDVIAVIS
jgi:hypothetical protein